MCLSKCNVIVAILKVILQLITLRSCRSDIYGLNSRTPNIKPLCRKTKNLQAQNVLQHNTVCGCRSAIFTSLTKSTTLLLRYNLCFQDVKLGRLSAKPFGFQACLY